ncbi:MAG: carboxypeptidase-like regulatory domain-containing protein [Saprospiraceae bacterium]
MDQEKTYKWIQDRIRDLHAGKLSAEDRLRMEELAKTDPFVQDAMEGYQANPDHDHSVLLKVIADRIQRKNESKRPKILPLSKGWVIPAVAASLVLILATWAVMFYIEKQGDAAFVAAEPKASTSIEQSTEVNLSEADSLTDDLVANDKKAGGREQGAGDFYRAEGASPSSSSVAGNDNESKELKADAQPESKPSLARKESVQKSKGEKFILDKPADDAKNIEGTVADKEVIESEDELSKEPVATSPAPPITQEPVRSAVEMSADKSMAAGAPASKLNTKKDEGYFANQMSPDVMKMLVSGKVIDDVTGEEVIFAQIAIANTNLVETTDLDGNFTFYIPDSTETIITEYTGYSLLSTEISQGNSNILIKLHEGEMDGLIGKDSKGKYNSVQQARMRQTTSSYKSTTRFREYLNTNSLFPLATTFDPSDKMVKLEFNITAGQKMEFIKILKSSGSKLYEEEAIRLLKMGPTWSCEDGKYPCTREFTIYFK